MFGVVTLQTGTEVVSDLKSKLSSLPVVRRGGGTEKSSGLMEGCVVVDGSSVFLTAILPKA